MRNKALTFLSAGLLGAGAAYATLQEFDEVPVTRWVEGGGARKETLAEIRASWDSDKPFSAYPARPPATDGDVCCIVVNEFLYSSIEGELNSVFVPGIEADGYTVNVYLASGGEPADLRDFLIARYGEAGDPFTAIFIGDLPVAMFEIPGGWNEGEPFPCDLFYMDLDGTWRDDGHAAGVYDVHLGAVEADIRFGRLTAGPLTYSGAPESELLAHYFNKAAAFRAGNRRCRDRALCYVDDDWEPYGLEWGGNMRQAYPKTDIVYDPYTTWDTDYEERLRNDYEFIQVCVHSNPLLHQFHRPGNVVSYTYMSEVYELKPVALFYNLFACSNARFTSANYMAGWYTFMDNDFGLAAVGSTKTGSMLHFADFYGPLGRSEPLGEAFRYWFAKWADAGGQNGRDWHYGMTVIGDPTLHVRPDFVPVLIRRFTAHAAGEGVVLRWEYGRGLPVDGFNLYRVSEGSPGREQVNAHLLTGVPPMTYRDDSVRFGRRYVYELEAATGSRRETVAATEVDLAGTKPAAFALAAPAPNPAREHTIINYVVTAAGAKLTIYDTAGRRVKDFKLAEAGPGTVTWTVDDGTGKPVPAGVYIIRLDDGVYCAAARVVVARR